MRAWPLRRRREVGGRRNPAGVGARLFHRSMLLAFRWLLPVAAVVSAYPAWAQPTVEITGGSATEGDAIEYTVTLSRVADQDVEVQWETDEVSAIRNAYAVATEGADYTPGSGSLTFEPGETKKTISVQTKQDTIGEAPEAVVVTLSNLSGGAVFKSREGSDRCPWDKCGASPLCCACGLIVDDGDDPGVSISDAWAKESDGGMGFRISLNKASESTVSVSFATEDGTAVAGEDYTRTTRTVEFSVGETSRTVTVPIIDDDVSEQNETMIVRLSDIKGAYFIDEQAQGTIVDTEHTLTVSDASGSESVGRMEFTLTLDKKFPRAFGLRVETRNGTAVGGGGSPENRL